jgi:hypothetical protein
MKHNKPWKRVVRPGTVDVGRAQRVPLFVEIEWQHDRNKKWELSISGVEGPWSNGNCAGSCGQCRESLLAIRPYPNWDRAMARTLYEYWDRWHLNGTRAGSPAQEEFLRNTTEKFPGYPASHYDWASKLLAEAGINPDPTVTNPHQGRTRTFTRGNEILTETVYDLPYKYGSSWLYEEVPEHVLDWLYRLPTAGSDHPWGDTDRFMEEA